MFDGSIERISCVTKHEDYVALTNRTVLLQVAPLLKDRNGRSYRRRTGVSEPEEVIFSPIARPSLKVTVAESICPTACG